MYTQEDFRAVTDQIKVKVSEGKVTCHRCKFPLNGENISQIDLFNARVLYKCPNDGCENNTRTGYRSFRAIDVTIPTLKAPTDLASVQAPAPPQPEEVNWSDESDEVELDINDPDSEE